MFRKLFGRKKSVEQMIATVFPVKDQPYAKHFYETWSGKGSLVVDLGDDEFDNLSAGSFYSSATFYFFSIPGESGEYGVLGADMDDPLGMVAVRKKDGEIVYLYDDTETSLAASLKEFISALVDAGWDAP